MLTQELYHTYQRFRTLRTSTITALPVVILMPHSACNCQCVMCDIWKGNKNLKQLRENDILQLLDSLRKFGTKQVVMSGGEAMLNPNFFLFCEILKQQGIAITVLSTGLTLQKHAEQLVRWTDELIVSLDGDEKTHDRIRNVPNAFRKLKEGIQYLRSIKNNYKISARTVIHRLNFSCWSAIVEEAADMQLDRISFLPADVSSTAFNREIPWDQQRQEEILPSAGELPALLYKMEEMIAANQEYFANGFIAESPLKIRKIYQHYAAHHGLAPFAYKKCNAPWVSTVIEADGNVLPCFFHPALGNIREAPLEKILNSDRAIAFRKNLDMDENAVCKQCVCYLNLKPGARV
jgi:MoaA/NifB/PqqE/SkfB family radical SAM enzyme